MASSNDKYRKRSTTQYVLRLYPSESAIREKLESVRDTEGINPYLKRLILEDIGK